MGKIAHPTLETVCPWSNRHTHTHTLDTHVHPHTSRLQAQTRVDSTGAAQADGGHMGSLPSSPGASLLKGGLSPAEANWERTRPARGPPRPPRVNAPDEKRRRVGARCEVSRHGLALQPVLVLDVELLQILQRDFLLFLAAAQVQPLHALLHAQGWGVKGGKKSLRRIACVRVGQTRKFQF